MNINWKVRFRSGAFWIGVTGLAFTLLYYVFDLVGFIPAYSQEQIVNVVMMVVQILSFIGIVTDPTTKGINDSERAMKYKKPAGTVESVVPELINDVSNTNDTRDE